MDYRSELAPLPEFRSLRDRSARQATAAEARRQRELEDRGVTDVYAPVEEAPAQFWEAVLQATLWAVLTVDYFNSTEGRDWWDELGWHEGWPPIRQSTIADTYANIIRHGGVPFLAGTVDPDVRLSAIELLLDVVGDISKFRDLVNQAAERFRVGIQAAPQQNLPIEGGATGSLQCTGRPIPSRCAPL